MKDTRQNSNDGRDPFGLSHLPLQDMPRDGWPGIEQGLKQHRAAGRRYRLGGWLAAAACLLVVLGLVVRQSPEIRSTELSETMAATNSQQATSVDTEMLSSLISLSQEMETRVRQLRDQTGSMPSNALFYVAELEDLVAQVDTELSFQPASLDLWGQRINLLLDIEALYDHELRRDRLMMASL